MKTNSHVLIFSVIVLGFCCSKGNFENEDRKLCGTWIEKYPQLYDNVSDTIVFTDALVVENHFYFKGYAYKQKRDSIEFLNNDEVKRFLFEFLNLNEIVIHNFMDRSITSEVKNIHFLKLY